LDLDFTVNSFDNESLVELKFFKNLGSCALGPSSNKIIHKGAKQKNKDDSK
jgi:hypothetical protein